MRCTQPMGLPLKAETFLHNNAERLDVCDHCGRDSGFKTEVIDRIGMFEDLPLLRYTLKDGTQATEYVQTEIWSSGPMIWLGLRTIQQNFEWDKSEITEE
jgi:hypothetical protein